MTKIPRVWIVTVQNTRRQEQLSKIFTDYALRNAFSLSSKFTNNTCMKDACSNFYFKEIRTANMRICVRIKLNTHIHDACSL